MHFHASFLFLKSRIIQLCKIKCCIRFDSNFFIQESKSEAQFYFLLQHIFLCRCINLSPKHSNTSSSKQHLSAAVKSFRFFNTKLFDIQPRSTQNRITALPKSYVLVKFDDLSCYHRNVVAMSFFKDAEQRKLIKHSPR